MSAWSLFCLETTKISNQVVHRHSFFTTVAKLKSHKYLITTSFGEFTRLKKKTDKVLPLDDIEHGYQVIFYQHGYD